MKSTDRILAKRYAKAYDALTNTPEQAASACQALRQAAALLAEAGSYMQAPAIPTAEKIAFVQQLFGEKQTVTQFLAVLLKAKRYYLLDACLSEVQDLLDARQGVVRAEVQSAFELTQEAKQKVQQVLSTFTGKKAVGRFTTDKNLLGGLRVRIGDTWIDGSLKGRFEKLQEQLTK